MVGTSLPPRARPPLPLPSLPVSLWSFPLSLRPAPRDPGQPASQKKNRQVPDTTDVTRPPFRSSHAGQRSKKGTLYAHTATLTFRARCAPPPPLRCSLHTLGTGDARRAACARTTPSPCLPALGRPTRPPRADRAGDCSMLCATHVGTLHGALWGLTVPPRCVRRAGGGMQAGPTKREISVLGRTLTVISFVDRRRPGAHDQGEFLAQYQLESLLYDQHLNTTGAVYRLLRRAGVGHRALALRRASVAQGLLSDAEFDQLKVLLDANWLRSFTLVPLDAVQAAVGVFGASPQSTALPPLPKCQFTHHHRPL